MARGRGTPGRPRQRQAERLPGQDRGVQRGVRPGPPAARDGGGASLCPGCPARAAEIPASRRCPGWRSKPWPRFTAAGGVSGRPGGPSLPHHPLSHASAPRRVRGQHRFPGRRIRPPHSSAYPNSTPINNSTRRWTRAVKFWRPTGASRRPPATSATSAISGAKSSNGTPSEVALPLRLHCDLAAGPNQSGARSQPGRNAPATSNAAQTLDFHPQVAEVAEVAGGPSPSTPCARRGCPPFVRRPNSRRDVDVVSQWRLGSRRRRELQR